MAARMPAQPAPTMRTSCLASTTEQATQCFRPGPLLQQAGGAAVRQPLHLSSGRCYAPGFAVGAAGGGGGAGGGGAGGGAVTGRPMTTPQSPPTVSAASAIAVSLPPPQRSLSLPGPPTSTSLPLLPTSVSLPAFPKSLSLPAFPLIVSAPLVPLRTSFLGVPLIVLTALAETPPTRAPVRTTSVAMRAILRMSLLCVGRAILCGSRTPVSVLRASNLALIHGNCRKTRER